jgi:hypothetical protein
VNALARAPGNRYLPAQLVPRTRPMLVLFLLFLGLPIATVVLGVLSSVSDVFAILAVCTGCLIPILFILVLVPILTSLGKLNGLGREAIAGDADRVLPAAHSALRWVFRGDIRLSAFFHIGLVAEARGDFGEAAEAFKHALASMPMGNVAKTKRRVGGLAASHLAFCLAGCGRPADARNAIVQAQQFLMIGPGALDFMDSLNAGFTALGEIEPGRDPRAVAALAGAATAYANGAFRDALDIVTREQQTWSYGLLPRERALVAMLDRRARAALEAGGAMRTGGGELVPQNGDEAWATRYLSGS